jgi:hypothetical protein
MITTIDALNSLTPNAIWTIPLDGVLQWKSDDITQPTQAEIDAEVTRLQGVYDAKDYSRKRRVKYNALNQDEMRYDDTKNSTTTWVDAIDAIKAEFPKP